MLGGEATNNNCIVFGFNRSGLDLMIYRTQREDADYYITNAVTTK
jgi:hypothetical protein